MEVLRPGILLSRAIEAGPGALAGALSDVHIDDDGTRRIHDPIAAGT